jgi:hypothetical protein
VEPTPELIRQLVERLFKPPERAAALALWFGLDTLTRPHLITWAVKCTDLDDRARAARAAGLELGEVRSGQREPSDGQVLSWRLTYPTIQVGAGLVPFLIDWGRSRHPAQSAPAGARLVELWAEHPDPPAIRASLRVLGFQLPILYGTTPALIAVLDSPNGKVELR